MFSTAELETGAYLATLVPQGRREIYWQAFDKPIFLLCYPPGVEDRDMAIREAIIVTPGARDDENLRLYYAEAVEKYGTVLFELAQARQKVQSDHMEVMLMYNTIDTLRKQVTGLERQLEEQAKQ